MVRPLAIAQAGWVNETFLGRDLASPRAHEVVFAPTYRPQHSARRGILKAWTP
jgi:hypothetical protein